MENYHIFEIDGGFCGIAWNAAGITKFQLPAASVAMTERAMLRKAPGAIPASPPLDVANTIEATRRYFDGEPIDFSAVQLDLSDQDAFFQQIYSAVRQIGWGHTTTYGTVAKALGDSPEMARDVGQAMAHNPVPLIIPCHRVLAAGGKVGGFSAPGGAVAKQRMLGLEGIHVTAPRKQESFQF
jgi:methylated-DNA-[protein]-cysteine S-methyltransferase